MKFGKKIVRVCLILMCTAKAINAFAVSGQDDILQNGKDSVVSRGECTHYLSELLTDKGFIMNCENETMFLDVNVEHANYNDIVHLKKLSVINGVGNDKFNPDDNATYQDIATMVSRLFLPDSEINKNYSTYPSGYIKFAVQKGLFKNIAAENATPITHKDLSIVLNNLEKAIVTYDLMERLGCDEYNGEVYIDYYPKSWQGFEERPGVTSNGYFRILPGKLLYSYDNVNWNTLYEDIDGERVYYNLPEDINIDGARYAWEYNCFVNAPFDVNKKYYSYDNKTWIEGKPVTEDYDGELPQLDDFIFGIEKESILQDKNSGLYFSWQPYEDKPYYSKRYETILQDIRYNMIWVSDDAIEWVGIKIPDEMVFFTSAGMNNKAQALIIDGAVEFTQEEKDFLENEEKIAAEMGLGYEKPAYKTEKYILRFSELKKLLENVK